MCKQNSVSGFFENWGHCIDDCGFIDISGIRSHHSEKIVERNRIFWKLNSFIKIRIQTDSELCKPSLVIGSCRNLSRFRRLSGIATTRLVDEINGKTFSQKHIRKSLSSVRGGLA